VSFSCHRAVTRRATEIRLGFGSGLPARLGRAGSTLEVSRTKADREIIRQGVAAWNEWREKNPGLIPELSGAHLFEANLFGVNFSEAHLFEANLYYTNLIKANLRGRTSSWQTS
jgi:hypothetical protein